MLIEHHLGLLYDKLLEANLSKIVEPFSCVEIARVAELIDLPLPRVERKLSQMILDKKLSGILDQGRGHLILYPVAESDNTTRTGSAYLTWAQSLFRRAGARGVRREGRRPWPRTIPRVVRELARLGAAFLAHGAARPFGATHAASALRG